MVYLLQMLCIMAQPQRWPTPLTVWRTSPNVCPSTSCIKTLNFNDHLIEIYCVSILSSILFKSLLVNPYCLRFVLMPQLLFFTFPILNCSKTKKHMHNLDQINWSVLKDFSFHSHILQSYEEIFGAFISFSFYKSASCPVINDEWVIKKYNLSLQKWNFRLQNT